MVAVLIPVIGAIVAGLGIILGILWIFGLAFLDTVAPKRHAPANTPIPGFYVPRWGAAHRRQVRQDHEYWEENFRRALPPK
jgi:hypothetical protein